MSKTDAEYMRAYRARRKARVLGVAATMEELADITNTEMARQAIRIAELEDEVRHLKAELAKRIGMSTITANAAPISHTETRGFNSRPFTPAPKKGK